MRIDCLVFLMNLCMYHPPSCVHPHIPVLMPVSEWAGCGVTMVTGDVIVGGY